MRSISSTFFLLVLAVITVVQAAPTWTSALSFFRRDGVQSIDFSHVHPRGPDPKKKRSSTVIEAVQIDVTETQKSERELTVQIKEIIVRSEKTSRQKDKKRKTAYKNKNKDKTTVIQVIQVIVDIRLGTDNAKTRYAQHDVTADNGKQDSKTVQVTDTSTMTISSNATAAAAGSNATVANAASVASGAGSSAATGLPAIQTMDPNAPFNFGNATVLMSAGSPPPTWTDVQPDPAANTAAATSTG
ncbi:MAG: hypothetical protein M4579_001649 [Chaenotheca gracillima]|nr:MAG: hypothetical protein M4579_001649 [Chaenotheca gracillima]